MIVRRALEALAVARSSEADESTLAVYLHALLDLDEELVVSACERLSLLPRREFQTALPDVGTIRTEAARIQLQREDAAARRRLTPGPSADDDPRTWVSCAQCEDGGYQHFRCTGGSGHRGLRDAHLPLVTCGRRRPHLPHTYSELCRCVDTNPVIAHRRDRRQARMDAA